MGRQRKSHTPPKNVISTRMNYLPIWLRMLACSVLMSSPALRCTLAFTAMAIGMTSAAVAASVHTRRAAAPGGHTAVLAT